jgi:long-chain fatty acid transport protein
LRKTDFLKLNACVSPVYLTKKVMPQPTNKYFVLEKITARLSAKSLVALALVTFLPAHLFALGIRLPDQDAFATARGEAFAATADNPSAIYYNPAGISQLDGINARIGGYGILLGSHFESGSTSVNTRQKLQGIPQLYVTGKIPNLPLTLGLGVYSPYGLGLEWPDNAPFLVSPNFPKKGEIEYLTINPVVAWKPFKTLSVSAGPTFNHAETELQFLPFGTSVNNFRFRGRDDDLGFNAGILWHPLKQHSFGVSYRSGTTMDFQGHADTRIPALFPGPVTESANARFQFPQNVVLGYSFRPNKKWNFEVNADWTDWHRLNTLTLNKSATGMQSVPLNWDSSWFYEFGATRYFKHGWHVSGGYIYSENSVPSASFNPIVPDSDRHIFSLGFGRKYKHISWDATYQLAYGPECTISDQVGFNAPANGKYTYLSHALSLSFGYHF